MRKIFSSLIVLGLQPKWIFLAVSWLCAICLVVFCSSDYKLNQVGDNIAENAAALTAHQNEIGAFAAWRRDPKANGRPIYSIGFKNLCAENAHFGVFKTALHKVVKIEDLQAKFFQYSTDGRFDFAQAFPLTTFSALFTPEDNKNGETILDEILGKYKDKKRAWSFSIDLSNVSEVRFKNLDYKIFDNGALSLGIRCKRAHISYKSPEIILRGHATITTADGSTLESNHIRWDTREHRFRADGTYFLNRNGRKTSGKGICVDSQLNTVWGQSAKGAERSRKDG